MNDTQYFFVGITKSKTAISESFLDLVSRAPGNSVVLHGMGSGSDDFPSGFIKFQLAIGVKSYLSVLLNLIFVVFRLFWVYRSKRRVLVAYSTLPINWLVGLILRPNVFYVWSHDPIPHTGENFYNSKILPIDFKICTNFLRANVLCGSVQVKNILEKMRVGGRIDNILFPYISALVDASVSDFSDSSTGHIDILFFGRMEEYKGIKNLIRALHLANDYLNSHSNNGRTYNVVFAGRGPLLDYIKSQNFSGSLNVNVVEFPSNNALKNLLLRTEYCCFPYIDGTGSQVMQSALALGCRIICSDISIFQEVASLVDPRTVDIFPSHDFERLSELISTRLSEVGSTYDRSHFMSEAKVIFSPGDWSERVASKYV